MIRLLPLLSRLLLKVGNSTDVFLVAFGFSSNSVDGKALLFLNQKNRTYLPFTNRPLSLKLRFFDSHARSRHSFDTSCLTPHASSFRFKILCFLSFYPPEHPGSIRLPICSIIVLVVSILFLTLFFFFKLLSFSQVETFLI